MFWTPARSETSTIMDTNEVFLVEIDVCVGRSELIAWTTFSCSLTEHVHF